MRLLFTDLDLLLDNSFVVLHSLALAHFLSVALETVLGLDLDAGIFLDDFAIFLVKPVVHWLWLPRLFATALRFI